MSFLSRLFKKKENKNSKFTKKIDLFFNDVNKLLKEDRYICKSEYCALSLKYKDM